MCPENELLVRNDTGIGRRASVSVQIGQIWRQIRPEGNCEYVDFPTEWHFAGKWHD